jgi:hypothetical protein
MIKQFEHKLNERKRDDPNWDAGPRWVAAIACEADQPGVKREIEREGLAPPDSAFQFSEKKVPMVEGVQALFKAIPDLLKAAKTQWPGQPVKIQIVADPSAAWAIRNYDYKNHPVTPLPDALQAGSPKDLVAKSGDEVPIPLKDRRGYPHKLPWYITTIKTYSNMKTYDGSLNKPSQKQ